MSLGFFLIVSTAAWIAGAAIAKPALRSWYPRLLKPAWTPPNRIFSIVWTLLYILMAVAAWLVSGQSETRMLDAAMTLFCIQLFLNVLWSLIFFGLRNPHFALFEIICLWLMVFLTTIEFWTILPQAGILFLPYLGWMTFTLVLNIAIVRRNPFRYVAFIRP